MEATLLFSPFLALGSQLCELPDAEAIRRPFVGELPKRCSRSHRCPQGGGCLGMRAVCAPSFPWVRSLQNIPNSSLAASDMRLGFQGGSQTISSLRLPTPGMPFNFISISSGID